MSYAKIPNLYKDQDILLFKECYAMEKVHGTSSHISWRDGQLHLHSGGASSHAFSALFDIPDLTAKITEKIGQAATIYGEAHGGKLLGMSKTYGQQLRFVVFEIKINDIWLAVPNAHALAESLGLQFVHYVKIPTTLEAINQERDADSVQAVRNGIGNGKIREGVVLRPLIEVRKNNDERIITKHKRDEFRETQEIKSVEVDPAKIQVLLEAGQIASEWVTFRRLEHILDKMPHSDDNPLTPSRTQEVIYLMLNDILQEGKGEFVDSEKVHKAIGKKVAALYNQYLQDPVSCKNCVQDK